MSNCIDRANVVLRDFQKKVVKFINDDKNDSLLVVHNTGSGKTLTSITASQCYLDNYPDNKVIFIGPAGLINNFKKEMKKYGVKNTDKYHLYSFEKYHSHTKKNQHESCKNAFVIIDEVHNLRSFQKKKGGLRSKAILEFCTIYAHKRLLLTATPFINDLKEFKSLIAYIYSEKLKGNLTKTKLKSILRNKVHYFNTEKSNEYPTSKEFSVPIKADEKFWKIYLKSISIPGYLSKDPEAFYNAVRRAVNFVVEKDVTTLHTAQKEAIKNINDYYYSKKLVQLIPKIKKNKSLIFTNWIQYGIKPIGRILNSNDITFGVIHGDVSAEERSNIIEKYNNDKLQALVITRAGSEGIDLKGTRNVFILDPVWNPAGLQQIKGRAIRYQSHTHLPKDQQNVSIYKLIMVAPDANIKEKDAWRKSLSSGDVLLYNIVKSKEMLQEEVIDIIKEVSI